MTDPFRILIRLTQLALLTLVLTALLLAEPAAAGPQNAPCSPGAGYDARCDVDHDNDVDVDDILLTAGHWNYAGTWSIEPHNHDDRYYTKSQLNTGGGGGQVHWDNLPTERAPAGQVHSGMLREDYLERRRVFSWPVAPHTA